MAIYPPSTLQVYRQAVEIERKEQLLEKHRTEYVAGTDVAAKLRERKFEYASLNEHLLMLSLTRAVRSLSPSHPHPHTPALIPALTRALGLALDPPHPCPHLRPHHPAPHPPTSGADA